LKSGSGSGKKKRNESPSSPVLSPSPSILSMTSVQETVSEDESKTCSVKLVDVMKKIYDKRLKMMEKGLNVDKTNNLLDKIWDVIVKDEPIKSKHILCLQSHLNDMITIR
jgi:hypothetical protein